jgi:glycosyltransferase involved in cell wall biosynthesis
MKISFAIPAHNEEQLIAQTVKACLEAGNATGMEFEVIVACDACTDRTEQIAREAGAKTTICEKRIIAGSRNAAAAASTGDILFFVDADTSPPVQSVAEAIAALNAGAVGGGGSVIIDGEIPVSAAIALSLLNTIFKLCRLTGGCFLFCRRDAFEKAGRWDEQFLAGEEIDMARALKRLGKFVIVPTPVITSGRKLRTHTGWEFLKFFLSAVGRPGFRRDRRKLELWYGPRRDDPHVRSQKHGKHA